MWCQWCRPEARHQDKDWKQEFLYKVPYWEPSLEKIVKNIAQNVLGFQEHIRPYKSLTTLKQILGGLSIIIYILQI